MRGRYKATLSEYLRSGSRSCERLYGCIFMRSKTGFDRYPGPAGFSCDITSMQASIQKLTSPWRTDEKDSILENTLKVILEYLETVS